MQKPPRPQWSSAPGSCVGDSGRVELQVAPTLPFPFSSAHSGRIQLYDARVHDSCMRVCVCFFELIKFGFNSAFTFSVPIINLIALNIICQKT